MDCAALAKIAQDLGLKGKEAREFIKEQIDAAKEAEERQREAAREAAEREAAREERQREAAERQREADREAAEREAAREERQREHELELRRMELQAGNNNQQQAVNNNDVKARVPKLPPFADNRDEIDCYLERFERFAEINGWDRGNWASHLSALLTGKALIAYSRIPKEDSKDYDKLKNALLLCYNLTEDGYRIKFRSAKAYNDERPIQF